MQRLCSVHKPLRSTRAAGRQHTGRLGGSTDSAASSLSQRGVQHLAEGDGNQAGLARARLRLRNHVTPLHTQWRWEGTAAVPESRQCSKERSSGSKHTVLSRSSGSASGCSAGLLGSRQLLNKHCCCMPAALLPAAPSCTDAPLHQLRHSGTARCLLSAQQRLPSRRPAACKCSASSPLSILSVRCPSQVLQPALAWVMGSTARCWMADGFSKPNW